MSQVTEEQRVKYREYLNELRESGITNMYGAAPYLMTHFKIGRLAAQEALQYWMEHYGEE